VNALLTRAAYDACVAVLDKILELLGTNRTRMQWKLRAWRRTWDRRSAAWKNRAQALTYEHQTCPRCSHPAGGDERECTRCGEPLGGRTAHRARKLAGLLWAPDTPVVATVMVMAIIAMYAVTVLWAPRVGLESFGLAPHGFAFDRFGSLATPAVDEGEWWRLITSTFLHANLLHLAFNAMSLWSVASYLEDVLGTAKTLALYFLLGIAASATSYVWHTQTYPYVGNSVGASGAICGLIGVAIGFSLRRRNVARHLRGHYIGWAVWIAIIGMSSWNIDNAGHFGGLVPGVLCGLLVRRRADAGARSRRAWIAAAIALVALAIAALAIAAGHPLPDELLAALRDGVG
jgi:membrane associated rhomboid family serine protease